MVQYENNWTFSPHGRCDFLITPFAECIKNFILHHSSHEIRGYEVKLASTEDNHRSI